MLEQHYNLGLYILEQHNNFGLYILEQHNNLGLYILEQHNNLVLYMLGHARHTFDETHQLVSNYRNSSYKCKGCLCNITTLVCLGLAVVKPSANRLRMQSMSTLCLQCNL